MNLTENQILEALRQALSEDPAGPEGAMTTREICQALGWTDTGHNLKKVRWMLRVLIDEGKVKTVRKQTRTIAGTLLPVNAFQWNSPGERSTENDQEKAPNHNHSLPR